MLASIPAFVLPSHRVLKESNIVRRDAVLRFIGILYFSRHFWAETGRYCPLREEVWEPAGSHAGGAVCGLHPTKGAEGGGALPTAGPG